MISRMMMKIMMIASQCFIYMVFESIQNKLTIRQIIPIHHLLCYMDALMSMATFTAILQNYQNTFKPFIHWIFWVGGCPHNYQWNYWRTIWWNQLKIFKQWLFFRFLYRIPQVDLCSSIWKSMQLMSKLNQSIYFIDFWHKFGYEFA